MPPPAKKLHMEPSGGTPQPGTPQPTAAAAAQFPTQRIGPQVAAQVAQLQLSTASVPQYLVPPAMANHTNKYQQLLTIVEEIGS